MKNILVTGCSQGIGFEVVRIFAIRQDTNVLAIARSQDGLSKLVKECAIINPKFQLHTLSLDLAETKSIELIVKFVSEKMDNLLDGIIHNAGCLVKKPFTQITQEELETSFKINILSPFILTQKLMPCFTNKAHVLFVSSMGGLQGSKKFPGLSAYSTSKSTLMTLTECLAEEFKMTDFTFNCLALGAVQTEMLSKAFPGYKAPLSANEMGEFIVNFFIDGNKYFNGQVIPISLTTP